MKKYNKKTDNFSSHIIIARYISRQTKFNTKIIDLGCDVGFLGSILSLFKKKFEIHGVDINKKNLTIAKKYYKKVYLLDLNEQKWPIKEKFEIAVLADMLEHLYNPQTVIAKVLKLLKKRGILIISVPNIAFWWARLQILLGRFPKENRGIFDRTHIHFYTRDTLSRLLLSFPEIKIESFHQTTLPLQFVFKKDISKFPFNLTYNINYFLAKIWPSLFSYQVVIVATKI